MGKRYFCDYCQRSFADDIDSRQKHLNGVSHLRQKKEYYALNRDFKTLLREERAKEVCRRFRNTGECQYDFMCNFTHYSNDELTAFEQIVRLQEQESLRVCNVDDWLAQRSDRNSGHLSAEIGAQQVGVTTKNIALPPSLQPLTISDMKNARLSDWG